MIRVSGGIWGFSAATLAIALAGDMALGGGGAAAGTEPAASLACISLLFSGAAVAGGLARSFAGTLSPALT
jgi:hypothetical protein